MTQNTPKLDISKYNLQKSDCYGLSELKNPDNLHLHLGIFEYQCNIGTFWAMDTVKKESPKSYTASVPTILGSQPSKIG